MCAMCYVMCDSESLKSIIEYSMSMSMQILILNEYLYSLTHLSINEYEPPNTHSMSMSEYLPKFWSEKVILNE